LKAGASISLGIGPDRIEDLEKNMMKETFRLLVLGFLAALVVGGCAPDRAALEATVVAQVEADVEGTVAARPTMTAEPTYTAEPTHTAQPSRTAEPTYTTAPTLTPEPTYTPQATYTPEPTHTPIPTDTPAPVPTSPPLPTAPPTSQFTVAGVELTKGYMHWFPGSYGRCIWWQGQVCRNYDTSVDCIAFINNYNAIVARKDLAPLTAEEPILTAANIYRNSVQGFIDILTPQVAICQEKIAQGGDGLLSNEFGEKYVAEQIALIDQMEQVLNILRNVEAADGS
jgi:hypothetical protein